jgi:DNA-directed RNA polymerase specialized sigma24 family protein
LDNSERIRAIARRKLTTWTRAVYDSEEVFSSVLRRMDMMAVDGRLRPRSEGELWALIAAITHNCAVSRTRLIERARELLTDDGPLAYEMMKRFNRCTGDDEAGILVTRMMMALSQSHERQMLDLQLRGAGHAAIASLLGITVAASRQRWKSICDRLREWFKDEAKRE